MPMSFKILICPDFEGSQHIFCNFSSFTFQRWKQPEQHGASGNGSTAFHQAVRHTTRLHSPSEQDGEGGKERTGVGDETRGRGRGKGEA